MEVIILHGNPIVKHQIAFPVEILLATHCEVWSYSPNTDSKGHEVASKLTERQRALKAKERQAEAAKRKMQERNEKIIECRADGWTLNRIAVWFDLSHQRVAQIIKEAA